MVQCTCNQACWIIGLRRAFGPRNCSTLVHAQFLPYTSSTLPASLAALAGWAWASATNPLLALSYRTYSQDVRLSVHVVRVQVAHNLNVCLVCVLDWYLRLTLNRLLRK